MMAVSNYSISNTIFSKLSMVVCRKYLCSNRLLERTRKKQALAATTAELTTCISVS